MLTPNVEFLYVRKLPVILIAVLLILLLSEPVIPEALLADKSLSRTVADAKLGVYHGFIKTKNTNNIKNKVEKHNKENEM